MFIYLLKCTVYYILSISLLEIFSNPEIKAILLGFWKYICTINVSIKDIQTVLLIVAAVAAPRQLLSFTLWSCIIHVHVQCTVQYYNVQFNEQIQRKRSISMYFTHNDINASHSGFTLYSIHTYYTTMYTFIIRHYLIIRKNWLECSRRHSLYTEMCREGGRGSRCETLRSGQADRQWAQHWANAD